MVWWPRVQSDCHTFLAASRTRKRDKERSKSWSRKGILLSCMRASSKCKISVNTRQPPYAYLFTTIAIGQRPITPSRIGRSSYDDKVVKFRLPHPSIASPEGGSVASSSHFVRTRTGPTDVRVQGGPVRWVLSSQREEKVQSLMRPIKLARDSRRRCSSQILSLETKFQSILQLRDDNDES